MHPERCSYDKEATILAASLPMTFYTNHENGLTIRLYVQPGASLTGFAGLHVDAIKLRVKASAVEGEANKAVCLFLADFFTVPKSSVSISSGHRSRRKSVFVQGNNLEVLVRRLIAESEHK